MQQVDACGTYLAIRSHRLWRPAQAHVHDVYRLLIVCASFVVHGLSNPIIAIHVISGIEFFVVERPLGSSVYQSMNVSPTTGAIDHTHYHRQILRRKHPNQTDPHHRSRSRCPHPSPRDSDFAPEPRCVHLQTDCLVDRHLYCAPDGVQHPHLKKTLWVGKRELRRVRGQCRR